MGIRDPRRHIVIIIDRQLIYDIVLCVLPVERSRPGPDQDVLRPWGTAGVFVNASFQKKAVVRFHAF